MNALIVVCPACQTQFEVNSALIGAMGRKVRCGSCNHRWRFTPSLEEHRSQPSAVLTKLADYPTTSEVETNASPAPIPADFTLQAPELEPVQLSQLRSRGNVGKVAGIGLLIAVIASAVLFREVVMRAIPASKALYSLVHLAPADPSSLLEIANIEQEEHADGTHRRINVAGVVFNPTDESVDLPPLAIVFTDASGQDIDPANLYRFKEVHIEPGQNLDFRTDEIEMPDAAKSFHVGFLGSM